METFEETTGTESNVGEIEVDQRLLAIGDALGGGEALGGCRCGEHDLRSGAELTGRALNWFDRDPDLFIASLISGYNPEDQTVDEERVAEALDETIPNKVIAYLAASFAVEHASEFIGPHQENKEFFSQRHAI